MTSHLSEAVHQSWSIIILCYNEAGSIQKVVQEVQEKLAVLSNAAGEIILVNDGPSMGGFINPYTVPSAAFWKLGQAKPGDTFNFIEVSVEKAQLLRAEQSLICSEESLLTLVKKETNNNEKNKELSPIKIIDFDKNKLAEKERVKMMEKKGIKNMKIRFFN